MGNNTSGFGYDDEFYAEKRREREIQIEPLNTERSKMRLWIHNDVHVKMLDSLKRLIERNELPYPKLSSGAVSTGHFYTNVSVNRLDERVRRNPSADEEDFIKYHVRYELEPYAGPKVRKIANVTRAQLTMALQEIQQLSDIGDMLKAVAGERLSNIGESTGWLLLVGKDNAICRSPPRTELVLEVN